MKKSTKEEIESVLKQQGFYEGDVLVLNNFIGKKPSLSISLIASKKDSTKLYPEITGLIPCKKQMEFEITPAEIPNWMCKDAVQTVLADGFTIGKPFVKDGNKAEVKPVVKEEDLEDGSLPF